jgi:hypothetical protein
LQKQRAGPPVRIQTGIDDNDSVYLTPGIPVCPKTHVVLARHLEILKRSGEVSGGWIIGEKLGIRHYRSRCTRMGWNIINKVPISGCHYQLSMLGKFSCLSFMPAKTKGDGEQELQTELKLVPGEMWNAEDFSQLYAAS